MKSRWLSLRMWGMPAVLASGVGLAFGVSWWEGRAFVWYPEAEAATIKDIHAYKGKPACQACHAGKNARLRAEPNALCERCHDLGHKSHPVRVKVKPEISVDLPLGEGRTIVCHTCHDPHDLKAHKHALRTDLTPLCKQCHKGH